MPLVIYFAYIDFLVDVFKCHTSYSSIICIFLKGKCHFKRKSFTIGTLFCPFCLNFKVIHLKKRFLGHPVLYVYKYVYIYLYLCIIIY